MSIFHLDYETFSEQDIRAVGAYRYAEDPSTEILLASIAVDQGEPAIFVNPKYESEFLCTDPLATERLRAMSDPESVVYAHNAQFEAAVSEARMAKDLSMRPPALTQWRCTAAMCRRAALPGKLELAAKVLGLSQQKSKTGEALIKRFSMPQPKTGKRVMPWDDFLAFREFGMYNLQDVRAEQGIHKALGAFELTGRILEWFQLDMTINHRGLQVDVEALHAAKELLTGLSADLTQEFESLTGGLAPTQRDKFLEWLKFYGYPGEDLQAKSVEKALENQSWGTMDSRRALKVRQDLSFAATKKIDSMLACACKDGRVRGTLLWYGAGPGRWAGRLIQPQNFKRPTIKTTPQAFEVIKSQEWVEHPDMIDMCYGPPIEVTASCIRHFIQGPFFDADYSAIEARIVNWLAGQEDVLQEYRDDIDQYVKMACVIFAKVMSSISKDERWVGKQTVLGCGFGMGPDKFFRQCKDLGEAYHIKGVAVTPELAAKAVASYRKRHNKVVDLWGQCDRAARWALVHPGKTFEAGKYLKFTVAKTAGIPFLVMRLPAGRNIVYPFPAIEVDERNPSRDCITFYGPLEGRANNKWGRVKTYGGKFTENATQGTAADLMANGGIQAEREGYPIATLIHDQGLAYLVKNLTLEGYVKALTTLPGWAEGLPIQAEGLITPYYTKS